MSAIVFELRVLDRTGWIGRSQSARDWYCRIQFRPREHEWGCRSHFLSSTSGEKVLRTNCRSARQSGRLGQCVEILVIERLIVPPIHAVC